MAVKLENIILGRVKGGEIWFSNNCWNITFYPACSFLDDPLTMCTLSEIIFKIIRV
jgi:hypothetical protein